ncbi:copper resistance protein CopC [Cellulomonas sp. C5510]|nr:copper resistance protein CopC [Cellulomonas sp. C5510]
MPMVAHAQVSRRRAMACRLAIAAVLALGLAAAGAGAAWAHSGLIETDPADGASVEVAPVQVVLTFNEAPQPLGTLVQVLGPDGADISDGQAVITDTQIAQPLAEVRPTGTYTVQWRMTSADGHPLSGQFAFTATSATGTALDDPTQAAEATTAPTPSPTTPAPAPETVGTSQGQAAWRWGPSSVTALMIVAVVAAALLVLVVRLRRRVFGDDTSE